MAKELGPTFLDELQAAGVADLVQAVRHDKRGEPVFLYNSPVSAEQAAIVRSVYDAHDNTRVTRPLAYMREQAGSRLAVKLRGMDNAEIEDFVRSIAKDRDGVVMLLQEMLKLLAPIAQEFFTRPLEVRRAEDKANRALLRR